MKVYILKKKTFLVQDINGNMVKIQDLNCYFSYIFKNKNFVIE